MRLKLFKLLSLGLCFSIMAPILGYAAPVQEHIAVKDADSDDYDIKIPKEMAFPEYVVNEDTYETTDIAIEDSEDAEQHTFLDYFPDPNFAQGIAEYLGKDKTDFVTEKELSTIEIINLPEKNISNFIGVKYLPKLKSLSLNFNEISEIPDELADLTQLTTLSLQFDQIEEIPARLGEMTNLNSLILNQNLITEIPPEIGDLTNLKILYLNYNQITALPDELNRLVNLETLSLTSNEISEIPATFNIPSLKSLCLMHNKISQINANWSNMNNLTFLELYGNCLSQIPVEISNLINLELLSLNFNEISEIPLEIYQMPHLRILGVVGNKIYSEIPNDYLHFIFYGGHVRYSDHDKESASFSNQNVTMDPITIMQDSTVTKDKVLPPLFLQIMSLMSENQLGRWTIKTPANLRFTIDAYDGSEMESYIFDESGDYELYFDWTNVQYVNEKAFCNFRSNIKINVLPSTTQKHNVTVTTKYLDNALPESTNTYSVEHGTRFEQRFNVLDGYDLANTELRVLLDFDVDMDSKTVILGPVDRDYTIVLEFDKTPIEKHNVTVITRYLDNALSDSTSTYQVEHNASFLESFEVLEGYELYNSTLRFLPVFDVDMDNRTVGLSVIDRDYTIVLEFDKAEYKVNLNTSYLDGYLPDTTKTDWTRYGEGYFQTYEIAEGYQVANLEELLADIFIDETNHTAAINCVTQGCDINLKFEKKQYDVTIRVVYEDDSRDEQISTYTVPYGDRFETNFDIEKGYSIKKVSFNAVGVSINRSRQEVTVEKVTSPMEIVIIVR